MHSDGVNSTLEMIDVYDGLFLFRTWFPYYLQAPFISQLGKTTLAARLPFAIVGFLSICALYILTLNLTQKKSTAFLASLFMTCSVPTLLYFRTARYIGLPILLTVLLLIFYIRLYKEKKWSASPFIITAIIYFHTMYVEFFGAILGILAHFVLHRKETDQENLKKIWLSAAVIALFTLPWLVYISPVFERVANFYTSTSNMIDKTRIGYIKHFAAFMFQSNNYFFPFIFIPLLFTRPARAFSTQIQLLLFCILGVVTVSTLHSIPLYQYITAAIPLFYILLAIVVIESINERVWIKAVLVLALVATNVINVGPLFPVKLAIKPYVKWFTKTNYMTGTYWSFMREVNVFSLPYKYGHELAQGFSGPLDKVLQFFKTHGQPGDLCYMDNEIDSFVYYTGMKALHKNELTVKDKPIWIILRGEAAQEIFGESLMTPTTQRIQQIIASNPYEKYVLASTPNRTNSAYDVQIHPFESPPDSGQLLVYHLVESNLENMANPTSS